MSYKYTSYDKEKKNKTTTKKHPIKKSKNGKNNNEVNQAVKNNDLSFWQLNLFEK